MVSSADFMAGLYNIISNLKINIQKKFNDFYLKRLIELEIAPTKTFSFDFLFESPSSSSQRRSVSKLRGLIDKYLSKVRPALSLTDKPFIQSETSSSLTTSLNILEIECGKVLPKINDKIFEIQSKKYLNMNTSLSLKALKTNPYMARAFVASHPEYILLSRYVGYLNYLARKNNIPLQVFLKDHAEFTDLEDTGLIRFSLSIDIKFVGWECTTREHLDRYLRVQSGSEDDALFSQHAVWSAHPIADNPSHYRYHTANFFLHLDKCLKVLHTLSRKVDYGYSAFSFRTV